MGDKTGPVILAVAIVVAVLALMGWGWRGRVRRQGDVAEPPGVPADLGPAMLSVPGQYVATTSAGDWLDRIAVHGLGIRTRAVMSVHAEGVLVERSGTGDLYIGRDALKEVGTSAGMAGKFVEKDGLVVLTWALGGKDVDTGFRTGDAGAKKPLLQALSALLAGNLEERGHPEELGHLEELGNGDNTTDVEKNRENEDND